MKSALSAIFLALLSSSASAKDFECPNNDYGWWADPENCIRYFHCSQGVAEEFLCPTNPTTGNQECFDETTLICDDCFTVDCGERPVCDANDENCYDDEGFVCPEPTGLWPDPESCCQWYQCEEGRAFHMDCPYYEGQGQTYYDEDNAWCDLIDRVECGTRPLCE